MSWARFVAGAVGVGAVAVAGAALEARSYRVVRHELTLPRDSGPSDGAPAAHLRILHVSDMHYLKGQRSKARFIASLADQRPDLVVATGDLLADDAGFDELMDAMRGLLGVPGVFVFGSNDLYGPTQANPLVYLVRRPGSARPRGRPLQWRRVCDALMAAGWADLNNSRTRLVVSGLTIELRGSADAHIGLDDYGAAAPVAGGAEPPDLLMGVTHAPYRRVLDAMTRDRASLMLAGHTHGGQICAPWGAIVSNCDLPPAFAKGLHAYPPPPAAPLSRVHVTAGVGASPTFPLRLFCRPEACLLEVTVE